MFAAGCLLALVLPIGGAALGHWLDGTEGSMRGFAIGLCSAARLPPCPAGSW